MSLQPEELPLHMSKIETSQGTWPVAVYSLAQAQGGDILLLKLILEQSIDEQRFRTRELGMQVLAARLRDPIYSERLFGSIRQWIETTQGDGLLELG
jgi:hypothetical protein